MAKRRNTGYEGEPHEDAPATDADSGQQTVTETAPPPLVDAQAPVANGEATGAAPEAAPKKTRSAFYAIVETDISGQIGDVVWQGKSRRGAERFCRECDGLLRRTMKAVAILRVKPMGLIIYHPE